MADRIDRVGAQDEEGGGLKKAMELWAALLQKPMPGAMPAAPPQVRPDDSNAAAVPKTSPKVSASARRYELHRNTDDFDSPLAANVYFARERGVRAIPTGEGSSASRDEGGRNARDNDKKSRR